ncbi:hypothetical protein [Brevibacterium samyangense]|uniref:TadE-like protein n=1 Tax=Brevibacterium samyangense TaxID=366888 RepID=A0ABN2T8Q1_9MICO
MSVLASYRRALARFLSAPDRGSGTVEFVFVTVVLLVPVVYLVVALAQIQGGSFATHAAAVNAARAAARYPDSAEVRADLMTRMHFEDFGLEEVHWSIDLDCSADCRAAGTYVTATVEARIPVPGTPLLFGADSAPHVTVRGSHSDVVSPHVGRAQR